MYPEQLPTETAKSYAAFMAYCDLGAQRSLGKTRRALGKSSEGYTRFIEEWSSRHNWQERVRDYDASLAAERAALLREQRRSDIERLREEASTDAALLRGLARTLGATLAQRAKSIDYEKLEPAQFAGLLRSITASLDTATNLGAATLGIDEVLDWVNNGNTDPTE